MGPARLGGDSNQARQLALRRVHAQHIRTSFAASCRRRTSYSANVGGGCFVGKQAGVEIVRRRGPRAERSQAAASCGYSTAKDGPHWPRCRLSCLHTIALIYVMVIWCACAGNSNASAADVAGTQNTEGSKSSCRCSRAVASKCCARECGADELCDYATWRGDKVQRRTHAGLGSTAPEGASEEVCSSITDM